jgi:hypothetical protein
MSYGFRVYNENSEVVLDDTSPVYVTSSRQTLTGTFYVNNATYGNIYKYTVAPTAELLFWRLPSSGHLIARGALNLAGTHGWFANQSTIDIIKCTDVALSGASTGYGINVYSPTGAVTFRADKETFVIRDVLTLTFDQANVACSDQWFCIPNAHNGIYNTVGGTIYYRGTGVLRSSSSTIRSFDGVAAGVTPPPFIVLSAP